MALPLSHYSIKAARQIVKGSRAPGAPLRALDNLPCYCAFGPPPQGLAAPLSDGLCRRSLGAKDAPDSLLAQIGYRRKCAQRARAKAPLGRLAHSRPPPTGYHSHTTGRKGKTSAAKGAAPLRPVARLWSRGATRPAGPPGGWTCAAPSPAGARGSLGRAKGALLSLRVALRAPAVRARGLRAQHTRRRGRWRRSLSGQTAGAPKMPAAASATPLAPGSSSTRKP